MVLTHWIIESSVSQVVISIQEKKCCVMAVHKKTGTTRMKLVGRTARKKKRIHSFNFLRNEFRKSVNVHFCFVIINKWPLMLHFKFFQIFFFLFCSEAFSFEGSLLSLRANKQFQHSAWSKASLWPEYSCRTFFHIRLCQMWDSLRMF